jgi:hypothetical protein
MWEKLPMAGIFDRIFPNVCYENTVSNAEGIMKQIMCAEKKVKKSKYFLALVE